MDDPIRAYIETIMKEAGTWDMDPTLREPIVQNLMLQAQRRIGIAAMAAMDESAANEFETFLGKKPAPSPEQVVAFIQSKIPNFEEVMKKALQEFANEFVEGAKRLLAQARAAQSGQ